MESKHTKGKWRVTNGCPYIMCDLKEIAKMNNEINSDNDIEELYANAERIIECVNNYDALREENERLKEALKKVDTQIDLHIRYKTSGIGWLETAKETIADTLSKITDKEAVENEKQAL